MSLRHKKKKILVVAHDAGGAEVIAAYVKKYRRQNVFHSYVDDLAARIFKREGISYKKAPHTRRAMAHIVHKHKDAAFALLGTGWMTNIERNACREAKSYGIKTCIYLDSWMNYRERFGYPNRGWQQNLPDELWVGDSFALALAKRLLPSTSVRLVPNQYFANIRKRFRRKARRSHTRNMLVFFSTPDVEAGKIFSDLLQQLSTLKNPPHILIRFHPADDRGRYDALRERFQKKVSIHISREKDIVRDLLRARATIGPETMALAIAALVGLKAVCVHPRGRHPILPLRLMYAATSVKAALRLLGYSE